MSEYQYYEFRAIDTPLTESQKADVSKLSSRAYVTSHSASFVYNYSDFPGNTEKLMASYFDAMLYMANWGSRQLVFRLPATLVDMKQLGLYCISEEIDRRTTYNKKHIILEFDFHDEDQVDWIEGEGWLDDLIELREEIIKGDLRVFYLAWIKAAENAYLIEDIDPGTLEPPVPDGLRELSLAQQTFVKYLEINKAMIAVASQNSSEIQKKSNFEAYIEKLPLAEQHDYLIRLSRGEKNLSVLLNKRLQEFAYQESKHQVDANINRRTISALIESAKIWQDNKKKKAQQESKLARELELETLAPKKNMIWDKIESLIEEKKATAYKNAIDHLKNLRDLAEYQGELKEFIGRLADIKQTYSNRPALIRRIRDAKLIS